MPLRNPFPDEKVVLIIRRHWIIFLVQALINIALLIAPLPLVWFLKGYFPGLFTSPVTRPFIVIVGSTYYLLIWLFFYMKFIDLYLDVWIVSNRRVVNIEQRGIFARVESEHQLEKIQDITTEVRGIAATLLNFGNLRIQTAGENQHFVFKQVPNPYYLKKTLMKLVEKHKTTTKQQYTGI